MLALSSTGTALAQPAFEAGPPDRTVIEGSQRGPKDLRLLLPALWGWLVCALGIWLRPGPALSLAVLILTVVLCAWAWRSRRVVIAWVALAGIIATTLLGSIALGELTREQAAVMEASGQDVVAQVRLEKGFTPGMSSVEVRILRLNGAALSGGGVEARVIGFPFAQRVAFGASAELKAYLATRRAPQRAQGGYSWRESQPRSSRHLERSSRGLMTFVKGCCLPRGSVQETGAPTARPRHR